MRLKDVATVQIRPMQRQGATLRDGQGETVSGMVIMLKGENGKQVIERVKDRLASVDLGKTNSKLFVVSAEGQVIDEARTRPIWREQDDLRVLDDGALFDWMKGELARVVTAHGVDRITFSGHGCTLH